MTHLLSLTLLFVVMLVANGERWAARLSDGDWGNVLADIASAVFVFYAVAGFAYAVRKRTTTAVGTGGFHASWLTFVGLAAAVLMTLQEASSAAEKAEAAFQKCRLSNGADGIIACTQALQLQTFRDRDLAVILNNRGLLFRKAGEPSRAITDLDQAIATDASLGSAWFNRGLAKADLSQWEAAIEDFTEAAKLRPELAAIWASRGSSFLIKKRLDEAIADFDRAIALNDKEAIAWGGRGVAYYLKNDMSRAKADLKRASELDASNTETNAIMQEIEARESSSR